MYTVEILLLSPNLGYCFSKSVYSGYNHHLQIFYMRQILLVLAAAITICSNSQTAKQPVLITDMLKIKTIGNVTLTEDGSKAAFLVTSIEPETDSAKWEYKYTSQLWMTTTEPGASPRRN